MIHLICEEKVIVKLVSLVKLLNILVSAIGHISVVTTTTMTTTTMMMVVVIVMMMIKMMMGRNDAIKCKLSDRVLRPAQGLEHNIWWRNEYKYKYNQSTNTFTNTKYTPKFKWSDRAGKP